MRIIMYIVFFMPIFCLGKSINHVGIGNAGNTCYMASVTQCLLRTPGLYEILIQDPKIDPLIKSIVALADNFPQSIEQYKNQFLAITKLTAGAQEDAQEGWIKLIDYLCDIKENKDINKISLLNKLLCSQENTLYTCSNCSFVSSQLNRMPILMAPLKQETNLNDVITEYMQPLNTDNDLQRCDNCNQMVKRTERHYLKEVAPIFVVSLMRFVTKRINNNFVSEKINTAITVPEQLPLNGQWLTDDCEQKNSIYELYGLICHEGGIFGGHYWAYVKDVAGDNKWRCYNDAAVSVKQPNFSDSSIYMALYRQQKASNTLLVDDKKNNNTSIDINNVITELLTLKNRLQEQLIPMLYKIQENLDLLQKRLALLHNDYNAVYNTIVEFEQQKKKISLILGAQKTEENHFNIDNGALVFLDQRPVNNKQYEIQGDFNDLSFLEKIAKSFSNTFDLIIPDYSVGKCMQITDKHLKYFFAMLKPNGCMLFDYSDANVTSIDAINAAYNNDFLPHFVIKKYDTNEIRQHYKEVITLFSYRLKNNNMAFAWIENKPFPYWSANNKGLQNKNVVDYFVMKKIADTM